MSKDFDGKTILIVEDEFIVGSDLGQIVADAGANAVLANTASSASAKLAETQFDAVLLDIHLQDESTYPVADELRRRAIPFVDKPFTTETVTNVLKNLLTQPTH